MSATSSSDDPVQTVVDLLDGTAESNWPNGTKPSYIEKWWTTATNDKRSRTDAAAYVRSPDLGEREALSAASETNDETEVVKVQVWSRTDSEAATIASDVEAILEDYYNDRKNNTNWHRIRPKKSDDMRADSAAAPVVEGRNCNQYVVGVRVELQREDSIGT